MIVHNWVRAMGCRLLVFLCVLCSVACNKDLPLQQGKFQANNGPAPQIQPTASVNGATNPIPLEKIEVDIPEDVEVVGFANLQEDKEKTKATAVGNANEYLASLVIPKNVAFQSIYNTAELHIKRGLGSTTSDEVQFEVVEGRYLMATLQHHRAPELVEQLKHLTYYKVTGRAAFSGTPTDTSQFLPLAYKKAYFQGLNAAAAAFTKATKVTAGAITVGAILENEVANGYCHVTLAVAITAM